MNKNNFYVVCSTFFIAMLYGVVVWGQTQLGQDIDGEAASDFSGGSVSMYGNRVAIGTSYNDGNGNSSGHVRIYEWNGSAWTQLGQDIDGEAADDFSGGSVSLEGNRVAIGAHKNDGNGAEAGHVRIYEWNGTAWAQLGLDIDGEAADDFSGFSVSLEGDRVAIGAIGNGANGINAGHVRIYEWNGTAWIQLGLDIDGEAAWDGSGIVSLEGNRVAIGAQGNDGNGADAGHVRVYEWNGTAWIQLGLDIDGEATGDVSGFSVSLEGNRVAIGAKGNNGSGRDDGGHVRVYEWNGISWTQLGQDIDGEASWDESGGSVSMKGNYIAIGAQYNDGIGYDGGHVRIYEWNGTAWTQLGLDIDGESTSNYSGGSVSLEGNKVAIGAVGNHGNGSYSGHVRIYTLPCISPITTDTITTCNDYTWIDGNTYTSSNHTARLTLKNTVGCDSIVRLDLIITTIDTSISQGFSQNGWTLMSNETGATHQWIDCTNGNSIIVGATSQNYIPSNNGSYAVVVTKNGCVDTSSCINVTISDVVQIETALSVQLYPNPTDGIAMIVSEELLTDASLRIIGINGQLLREERLNTKEYQLDINLLPSAVYIVEIRSKEGVYQTKLIKR